ncbi:hypothetical protein DNK77_21270 [Enterobacter cloacae complex sp.]|nr:hypothetical protein DNK77_21270 [Enterobacter cloacae complex sp.]
MPVISKLALVLDIYSSLSLIWRYSYCPVFQGATSLYKAVSTGQLLKSAEMKWYRINDAGLEEEYFNMFLENVKVVSVTPVMANCKDPHTQHLNHMEIIELRYEKITWKFVDGNLIHSDSWNERTTA